jgi:hypothetical protein
MNVGSLLVADPKSAKLIKPSKSPLDDPTPFAEAAAVLRVAHRKQGKNAAFTQTLPVHVSIFPRNHLRPPDHGPSICRSSFSSSKRNT